MYKFRTFFPSFGWFQHSSTPPYKHLVTSLITNIQVVACIPIHTAADLQQFYFHIFNFSAVVTCAFTAPIFIKRQQSLSFCTDKIFSHYEFVVQLVFAPRFKQSHIPRYNYIKRQQQKSPRGIDKSSDPWTRLTCWIQELRNTFVSDRWQTFWHKSQMPHLADHILGQIPHCIRSLTRVKCPGVARGEGWVVLELTGT